ncbi:hypothetical protein evm_002102 [Chilo suppressalis]|nr:hypothetical protein evm_002102 [Chilo suppressalis]
MKRLDPFGEKSKVYCCEDHFDIENDMENYIKYKLVGGRIKLKNGIVPHKFKCQQEHKDKPERSAVKKHDRIKYFEKLLNKDEIPKLDLTEKPEEILLACCPDETGLEDPLSFANNDQPLVISKKNKGVQANLKDKGVHKSTMTDGKYFEKVGKIISDPEKVSVYTTNDTCSNASSHEMYKFDQHSNNLDEDTDTENSENETHLFRNHMQKAALLSISREPQLLLGLPKNVIFA